MAKIFTEEIILPEEDKNKFKFIINHAQNRTNTQNPDEYEYPPGAETDFYKPISNILYKYINILEISKKKIIHIITFIYAKFKKMSLYILIFIFIILMLNRKHS